MQNNTTKSTLIQPDLEETDCESGVGSHVSETHPLVSQPTGETGCSSFFIFRIQEKLWHGWRHSKSNLAIAQGQEYAT